MSFFLLIITTGVSAIFSLGWCPTIHTQKNFEIDKYLGIWHQEIRDKEIIYENGSCNTVEYTKVSNNTMNIISSESREGRLIQILSTVTCANSNGQCYHRFYDISPNKDYKIVMTDYKTVSIIYMCTDYFLFHISYAWVLTRTVGSVDLEQYANFLQDLGIKNESLLYTVNDDCSRIEHSII